MLVKRDQKTLSFAKVAKNSRLGKKQNAPAMQQNNQVSYSVQKKKI
jgi:hypothetical protein